MLHRSKSGFRCFFNVDGGGLGRKLPNRCRTRMATSLSLMHGCGRLPPGYLAFSSIHYLSLLLSPTCPRNILCQWSECKLSRGNSPSNSRASTLTKPWAYSLFFLGKFFDLILIMIDAAPIDEDAEDIMDDEGRQHVVNEHARMGGENLKGLNSPLPWLYSQNCRTRSSRSILWDGARLTAR